MKIWPWAVAGGVLTFLVVRRGSAQASTRPDIPAGELPAKPLPPVFPRQPVPLPPATYLSDRGSDFIAGSEGWRGKLYNDPYHCTIGYGHLVHKGKCDGRASEAEFKDGLTKAQGQALFESDLYIFVEFVRNFVKVPVNQGQLDALVSFCYNVGPNGFKSSTLLRKLNSGDYASVPSEMMRWVFAGGKKLTGLVNRRKREGKLFSKGIYS